MPETRLRKALLAFLEGHAEAQVFVISGQAAVHTDRSYLCHWRGLPGVLMMSLRCILFAGAVEALLEVWENNYAEDVPVALGLSPWPSFCLPSGSISLLYTAFRTPGDSFEAVNHINLMKAF